MATYTADAVALLSYLVDSLPKGADRAFAEAEAGEAIIEGPSTAVAEVLYAVSRDRDVRGVTLTGKPADARQALLTDGPVSPAPVGDEELIEYAAVVSNFSIHDGMVVASHRASATDAILTSDWAIRDSDVPVVWD